MTKIAIIGAAGAMGTRLSDKLRNEKEYQILFVEAAGEGQQKLLDRGDSPTPLDEAVTSADVVILTVPDSVLIRVAQTVVPQMRAGTLCICLDPAAPHSGLLPDRNDISYFVTHPTHPPLFNDEVTPEARRDFFGSGHAKQSIVCALMQGPEEHYALGEAIAKRAFRPILHSHRVTVEQMALLEPALAETVAATCLTIVREGLDEVVARGVPAKAARDFLMGHLNVEMAILFDEIDWEFSAGCKQAIEEAKRDLFQPDWKKVFSNEHLEASIKKITAAM